MNLFKTSVLNGIAVLIKTATMFLLNKLLAVYVGPSGYAAIGQFQNFIQIVTKFAGGAITTAVTKYTAEYNGAESKQIAVWKTAGSVILIFSFLVSVLILVFQKQLSTYIFQTTDYQSIFAWFAVFLVFFNFNALFLSILNGKKEIPKLVIANISGSIFSLIITGLLAAKYSLYGALVALSINQSIIFLVTFILCYRSNWFKVNYLFGTIDKVITKSFMGYMFMALTTAVCAPLAQMIIRSYVSNEFGINYAGYWEAMIRLSGAYLMLITMTLSVYYLPRLSELKDKASIKKEVHLGYKFIFPVAILGASVVYLLKDFLIPLLFSESFMPMKELFFWQMGGDVLKIGSWLLGYLMLSKAMTKLYIVTEIFASISLVVLTYMFTKVMGYQGLSFAYFVNYALYWAILSVSIYRRLD